MPQEKGKPASRYAAKVTGKRITIPNTRPRRVGTCGHTLAGRKGHGFVSKSGHAIFCGSCKEKNNA